MEYWDQTAWMLDLRVGQLRGQLSAMNYDHDGLSVRRVQARTRKSLGILESISLLAISWPLHQLPSRCTLETFKLALLTTYELRLKNGQR